MSTASASSPAAASAPRAASAARSVRRAPGAAWRRLRMPVRRSIQAASTPMFGAISACDTAFCGSALPRPATPAVRWSVVVFRGVAKVTSGSDDIGLHLRDVALDEALEHAARADVDELLGAERHERGHDLAPANRRDDRLRELARQIGERARRESGDDGD